MIDALNVPGTQPSTRGSGDKREQDTEENDPHGHFRVASGRIGGGLHVRLGLFHLRGHALHRLIDFCLRQRRAGGEQRPRTVGISVKQSSCHQCHRFRIELFCRMADIGGIGLGCRRGCWRGRDCWRGDRWLTRGCRDAYRGAGAAGARLGDTQRELRLQGRQRIIFGAHCRRASCHAG